MQNVISETIKQLPPLPESALKIEAIYQDPDSSFKEILAVLETDPLLTADILKAANSPLYGFSREINAISQVVTLFGMGTIRGFALASIVNQSFEIDLSPYGVTTQEFSERAGLRHALVTRWFQRRNPKLLDMLSPAAFLSDTGSVLIAQCLIAQEQVKPFSEEIAAGDTPNDAEQRHCDAHTTEVSAAVFDHWRFEPQLVDLIRYCETPQEAPDALKESASILHVIRTAVPLQSGLTDSSADAAAELAAQYALDTEGFGEALEAIKAQLAS